MQHGQYPHAALPRALTINDFFSAALSKLLLSTIFRERSGKEIVDSKSLVMPFHLRSVACLALVLTLTLTLTLTPILTLTLTLTLV